MSTNARSCDTRLSRAVSGGGLVLILTLLAPGCRKEEASPAPIANSIEPYIAPPATALREPPAVDLSGQDEAIVSAVENAVQGVLRNPDHADFWGQLGMVLMVHGFHSSAGLCLTEAARRDPTEARWPYYLYSLARETNRLTALLFLQTAATNINYRTMLPATRRAVRQRLAEALIEDGQPEVAMAALVPEPEDKVHDAGNELLRARCHFQLGQWAAAHTSAESAAVAPETRGDALRLLALLDQRDGKGDQGRIRLAEAALLPPWKRVDPLAEELDREGRGLRVSLQNANQLLNAGRFAEVRQLLNQTVLIYPESAYAWLMLGKAELEAVRWDRAENCFRKAVEHDPEMVEAHFQLGQALRGENRLAEAAASFRQGAELKRDSVPSQYMLGLTLTELGHPEEALKAFQVCLECRPQYAESHLRLAQIFIKLGKTAEAKAQLDSARRLAPFGAATTILLQEIEAELVRSRGP